MEEWYCYVCDKEEISSYYHPLPILDLRLWVPAKCEITSLPVSLPNFYTVSKHINLTTKLAYH